jgi:hypothetical protein
MDGWKASKFISTKAETESHQGRKYKEHAEEMLLERSLNTLKIKEECHFLQLQK